MTEEQLKKIYALVTECWHLLKECHSSRTEEEWTNCTNRANEIVQKYGKWSMNLVLDCLEILERRKDVE